MSGKSNVKKIATLSALSETHRMLQKTCRDFADNELIPNASRIDREHEFPVKHIREMGKLGLMSVAIPEEYGTLSDVHYLLITSKLYYLHRRNRLG